MLITSVVEIPTPTIKHKRLSGWLDRVMVLGSSQCRGILLLWHIVGQELAELIVDAGRTGCFCVCFISPVLTFLF